VCSSLEDPQVRYRPLGLVLQQVSHNAANATFIQYSTFILIQENYSVQCNFLELPKDT